MYLLYKIPFVYMRTYFLHSSLTKVVYYIYIHTYIYKLVKVPNIYFTHRHNIYILSYSKSLSTYYTLLLYLPPTPFFEDIDRKLGAIIYRLAIVINLTNSMVNPIVFSIQYRDYQRTLKKWIFALLFKINLVSKETDTSETSESS